MRSTHRAVTMTDEPLPVERRRATLVGSVFTFGVEAAFVAALIVLALVLSAVITTLV